MRQEQGRGDLTAEALPPKSEEVNSVSCVLKPLCLRFTPNEGVLYPTPSCTRAATERMMVEVAIKDYLFSYCLSLDPLIKQVDYYNNLLTGFLAPNLTSSSFSSFHIIFSYLFRHVIFFFALSGVVFLSYLK